MALIRCNECRKEISDKTTVCPLCGSPVVKQKSKEVSKITIVIVCLIGIVAVKGYLDPAPKKPADMQASTAESLPQDAARALEIPSDAKANYYILETGKDGSNNTLVSKRVGPSGTTYSKRSYDCKHHTVKYLGTGDSLQEMNSSMPDKSMSEIVEGSIAYYLALAVCKF